MRRARAAGDVPVVALAPRLLERIGHELEGGAPPQVGVVGAAEGRGLLAELVHHHLRLLPATRGVRIVAGM